MSMQNVVISNLLGGVSTQNPTVRYPNQVTSANNMVFDPVHGCGKRPNTNKMFDIRPIKDGTQIRQHIFKDSQNNLRVLNLVAKNNGDFTIYMYDDKGKSLRVNTPTANPLVSASPQLDIGQDWAGVFTPYTENDFDVMTIGDIAYVLNKRVPVKMSTSKTYPYYAGTLNSTTAPYVGFIWIKTGSYSTTYDIEINGNRQKIETKGSLHDRTADARNAEKGANTNNIVSALYKMITAGTVPSSTFYASSDANRITDARLKFELVGNVIWVSSHQPLTIINHGSEVNVNVAVNKVSQISDLPPLTGKNWGNEKPYITVAGDNNSAQDDYVMRFIDGVWTESVPPNSENDIDQKALFTFTKKFDSNNKEYWEGKPIVFDRRKVGDNTTNPRPSFIGNTLNGMFTHNNRFGIISGENLIMAQSGEFIKPDFWNKTTLTSLDTDPIDIAVATDEVNNIHSVVQLSKNLLAFSDKAQFVLQGDTPLNSRLYKTTTYDNNPNVKPIAHGNFVYFVDSDNGVWEMGTNNITENTQAVDISEHVKGYLNIPIKQIIGDSENKTILFRVLNNAESIGLYVYKYHYAYTNQGIQKQQSAWGKWNFEHLGNLNGLFKLQDVLYLVGVTDVLTKFDSMKLNGYNKLTMLDNLIEFKKQRWTHPVSGLIELPLNMDDIQLLDSNFKIVDQQTASLSKEYNPESIFYAGYKYDSNIELSPIYIKGKPQLGISYKRMFINYEDAAYFDVEVDFKGRKQKKTFNNRFINDNRLDRVKTGDGTFEFITFGDNKNTKITISSDKPYNFAVQNITHQMRVTARRGG